MLPIKVGALLGLAFCFFLAGLIPWFLGHAITDPARLIALTCCAVAVVMLAIGLGQLIQMRTSRQHLMHMIAQDNVVQATITGASFNTLRHMGNKAACWVTCMWTDPTTGQRHDYTTQEFWSASDPDSAIVSMGIHQLPVYINPGDPSDYYVDDRQIVDFLAQR